jgi:ATP-dependent DNA helicase DinG
VVEEEATVTRRRDDAVDILARIRAGLPNGGEKRPGQVLMAEAVQRTAENGNVLCVAAGTGVGKGIAYLSGTVSAHRKAVVATSTIALQDQLIGKDLPLVAEQLRDKNFSYAILKGRSNYICRKELSELEVDISDDGQRQLMEVQELKERENDGADIDQLRQILAWSKTTETGDRGELSFEPSPATWDSVSRTSDTCPGRLNCKFGDACFAELARERAQNVDVLVVNTHLYALNVSTQGNILPPHEIAVFDEAHAVEEILSSALGSEFGPSHLSALARDTKHILEDDRLTDALEVSAKELRTVLDDISHPNGKDEPVEDLRLRGGTQTIERLTIAIDLAARAVALVQVGLRAVPESASEKVQSRKERTMLMAASILQKIRDVSKDDRDTVTWIENGRYIKTAPVNVGRVLDEWFWTAIGEPMPPDSFRRDDEKDAEAARPPRSVIFTSATIPISLVQRLHVPDPIELDAGSPFDFGKNAILYVPEIPDPKTDPVAWKKASHAEMRDLIMAAQGRTLALFTSVSAMHEAYETLRDLPFRILIQGSDLPKRRLLKEFSSDHGTCLFATRSFFQGVDVPGQTLSLVILDRIPFPRPGDPLIDAWQDEAGGGWQGFFKVCVPLAGTTLAQAAGRLIRTASDQGVVAVLDSRLAEATYRSALLATVPPMRRSRNKQDVLRFLSEIVARHIATGENG